MTDQPALKVWVPYWHQNAPSNVKVEGPFNTWKEAMAERKLMKLDYSLEIRVGGPFHAKDRSEAIAEAKKPFRLA